MGATSFQLDKTDHLLPGRGVSVNFVQGNLAAGTWTVTAAMNVYSGTVLGQALWSAINGDPDIDYVPVIEMLIRAGAQIQDGSLAWLARQVGRSSSEKSRIAEVLRGHGAKS
jgi:hypothetical protein